ncbi:MAG TPA: Fic family protein [Ferruginibacter sp.]|jgi:prophage maintenance system killer protein|nr:Fic family protein [Ferruginibacter sp.]
MSRIRPVTVDEYLQIIEIAKEIHAQKAEPIPSFHNSKKHELESCLQTPFTGFGGKLFYKGFIHKASMLFYLLARNHVMANGNKRLACLCLSYFCFINNRFLVIPENVFYDLAKETVLASEEDKDTTILKIEKTVLKYITVLPKHLR